MMTSSIEGALAVSSQPPAHSNSSSSSSGQGPAVSAYEEKEMTLHVGRLNLQCAFFGR